MTTQTRCGEKHPHIKVRCQRLREHTGGHSARVEWHAPIITLPREEDTLTTPGEAPKPKRWKLF